MYALIVCVCVRVCLCVCVCAACLLINYVCVHAFVVIFQKPLDVLKPHPKKEPELQREKQLKLAKQV